MRICDRCEGRNSICSLITQTTLTNGIVDTEKNVYFNWELCIACRNDIRDIINRFHRSIPKETNK